MRKKKLENQWRLYLNPYDFRELVDTARFEMDGAKGDFAELAIRLGGECGLRVSETVDVQVDHIRESSHPDVEMPFLRLYGTKATSGKFEDGKYRDTIIPKATYDFMHEVARRRDREGDEPVIDRSKRSIQKYIKQAGELTAERTGTEDFAEISSHDLRAYFASTLLVRHELNAEVVMEIGGWKDYQNLQPYLAVTGDDVIARAFREARGDLLSGYRPEGEEPEMPDPETDVEREQATIDALLE